MSIWNVHKILARVKKNEMEITRDQLKLTTRELKSRILARQ